MPASYVVDQKGIIRHAFVGPDFTAGASVETMLAALSDQGPKPQQKGASKLSVARSGAVAFGFDRPRI
jgi:hypothetical protein